MEFKPWEEVLLKDIAVIYDSLHKSPTYSDSGIPMIRVKDLKEGFLNIRETALVDLEIYEEFSKKYKPKQGDIVFSRVGTYGVSTYVNTDEKFCLGQNTVVIVANDVDSKFLYYSLISPKIKEQIEMVVTGSTQKTISLKNIRNFNISLPPKSIQKKIADILFSIDEKIEVNKNIISNLERISRSLFEHWFIDFEFPNEDGEPYKSSGGEMMESNLGMIPKDWTMGFLTDIATLIMGQSPKGETYNMESIGLPLLNGASDFKEGQINPLKYTNDPKKVSKKRDFIFGVRATVGNVTFVDKEYALGRGVGAARAIKEEYQEYLYFQLVRGINYLESTATGSVYINLTKSDIEGIKVVLPPFETVAKFYEITESLLEMKNELYTENELLKKSRDNLLPKLLSGEIELPDETEVTEHVPVP